MRLILIHFILFAMYSSCYSQRSFFTKMPEYMSLHCKYENSTKEQFIGIYLSNDSTVINGDNYYKFTLSLLESDSFYSGYLKQEGSDIIFIPSTIDDSIVCGLIPPGTTAPKLMGNPCESFILFRLDEDYTPKYIYGIGVIDSYFIELDLAKVGSDEIVYIYELTPTKLRHNYGVFDIPVVKTITVSDVRGIIEIDMISEKGFSCNCIFQDW